MVFIDVESSRIMRIPVLLAGVGWGLARIDFKEISPIFLGGVVDGLDGSENDVYPSPKTRPNMS